MVSTIRKQATSCTIGSTTFPEIVFYAYRPVGSGPGGNMVSPRFVANTVLPVAVMPHHLHYEVEVCIDADESALWTADYMTVPGTAVSALTVTESGVSAGVAKSRTVTFNSAYVVSSEPVKVEAESEHQLVTVKFLCLAEPSFGSWS